MKNFISVNDVANVNHLIAQALELKKNPFGYTELGENKTLGLLFLNPSLRTRLSSQRAAQNLGMSAIVMNIDKEGWALEFEDGAVMNGSKVEHIKDAAGVIGQYCDIIGIRCFPELKNREEDYNEIVINKFINYCNVPVISLESATLHPLQSLADAITIAETKKVAKPKVVLTWAPHIKALPQAVSNSFAEWMCRMDVDFTITHPEGYELDKRFTYNAKVTHNQQEALAGADYVYVKNWSAYHDYGKILCTDNNWMLTSKKLSVSNNAKIMHCLPVRRNVELSDELLDSPSSLVQHQAGNRLYAAQAVLKNMLETSFQK